MCNTPLIDVRPEADFQKAHNPAAANIPLEQLAFRVHELPAPRQPVRITDPNPDRARAAEQFFISRGTPARIEPFLPSHQSTLGPSTIRLWQPSPFLSEALTEIERHTPLSGLAALDIACGTGRDAVFMALRGLRVTAIDLLPDALSRATDLARRSGTSITTLQHNLEKHSSLPTLAPADLITVFRYLHRPLFPALAAAIKPGGFIVYETFHMRNRDTGRRPQNPAHLLESAELPTHFPNFQILTFRDAWNRDGRYFSSLLARKAP